MLFTVRGGEFAFIHEKKDVGLFWVYFVFPVTKIRDNVIKVSVKGFYGNLRLL